MFINKQTFHIFKRISNSQSFFSKSFATFAFSNKNYYLTLGIPQTATQAEIKAAYYKLAKQHHPDIAKGGAERFKEINEAYMVLSDAQKKTDYDSTMRNNSSSYSSNYQNQRTSSQQSNYHNSQAGKAGFYDQNDGFAGYRRHSTHSDHYEDFYGRWKRDFNEDFNQYREEARKHYEKEQEERARKFDSEFEGQLDDAIKMLRKKLLALALTFVGLMAFLRLAFPHKRQTQIVYDEKTNTVYSTDQKTFTEWMKNPNKDNYPFQEDPRFLKQTSNIRVGDLNGTVDLSDFQTNKHRNPPRVGWGYKEQ